MASIRELADSGNFVGSKYHKHAELSTGRQFTVDQSSYGPTVTTSIDCYITGIYMGARGNSVSIKQRYTVYISYSRKTQMAALASTRTQIMQDFEANFPQFKISDIFIPENQLPPPTPLSATGDDIDQYYQGSDLFKRLWRQDIGRFRVDTEREIFDSRVQKIKKQYGIR